MKRAFQLVLAFVIMLNGFALAQSDVQEKPSLMYFFENYCESCSPEQDFMNEFYNLTGKHISDYEYTYYNVRYQANRDLFNAICDEHGLAQGERFVPMAVVDGVVYAGQSKLTEAMPMDFMENESTDSVIYYLYAPACESCADAEKAIEALPAALTVTRGRASFESSLIVKKINIYDNPSAAQALFERYAVPEDRQTTPIVFLREEYLRGDSIARSLLFKLNNGLAVGTPLLADVSEASSSAALTMAGTAAAGFVAGFNPCALSMLLLFLSILLSSGRSAGRYAAVYLAAKFVTYMAIGTVFLSVLSAWNPTWLPLAAKLLLTVIGGVLIVLNVLDAYNAHRQKYGNIRNQLPGRLRRFLNERIKGALNGGSGALMVSVALLGVVVAASEFLCSGQLYLASITAGLSAGAAYGQMLMHLIIFCAAFLLPAIIITIIVVKSHSMLATSDALLKKMPIIKLATAIAMLLIILAAWLLI